MNPRHSNSAHKHSPGGIPLIKISHRLFAAAYTRFYAKLSSVQKPILPTPANCARHGKCESAFAWRPAYCASGSTGSATESTVAGSSLSLMYSSVPSGRGTAKFGPAYPNGTETAFANDGLEAIASTR